MQIYATPFFWGTLALFILTVFFYIGVVSLFYYWHEKKTTFVVLPLIYTFEFFIIGFFLLALFSLLLQYFPDILKALGS